MLAPSKFAPACKETQGQRDLPLIAVILPRGEALRTFVYSGVLADLQRDARLLILSVLPNENIERMLQEHYSSVVPLTPQPEHYAPRITREILDMAHGRRLWSEAAKHRWQRREAEIDSTERWFKRVGKKALALPFANQFGLRCLDRLESFTTATLRTSDEYIRLFRNARPDLVFNASHVHSRVARPVIDAAQALGIPTMTFLFSWDNLTSQGRIIPLYDHYFAWTENIKRDLLRIYPTIRQDQVTVTGTPQFDFHFNPEFHWSRERFCEHVGADPARPIVLYTTGMPNHMPGEERIVELIADQLATMHDAGRPQLLLRVYPKDRSGRFAPLIERRRDILAPPIPWEPNWLTPLPEDGPLWTNMLKHCALGINVASTVSLELCMFDKPVINIAFDPPGMDIRPVSFPRYYSYDHYVPIAQSGALDLAHSPEDLYTQIRQLLNRSTERATERKKLLGQFFGTCLDGRSSERVAEAILKTVKV